MNKQDRRNSRLDIERLRMAADRLEMLSDAYALALDDLRIARQGLKFIANSAGVAMRVRSRALDTLSIMYHKE